MRYTYILLLGFLLVGCMSDRTKRERFFEDGNLALDESRFEDAIEHYTNALNVDDDFADAYNNRGVAQIESGHPHEAIMDYNRALLIEGDFDECRLNRAYAYEAIGQYNNSLKDVNRLLKSSVDSAFLHFYKGLILTKIRDYPGALSSFRQSVELGTTGPDVWVNMGTIYFFMEKNDSARLFLEKAFDVRPDHPNALNTLSLIELDENRFAAALFNIERALEVVPEEPYFINNRGFIYLQMDSLQRALNDINRSIVLNPENGWAYRNKGIYYLKTGEYKRAIELLERSLQTNEFIDEIYYYLGQAKKASGDSTGACEAWKVGRERGEQRSAEQLFGCDGY